MLFSEIVFAFYQQPFLKGLIFDVFFFKICYTDVTLFIKEFQECFVKNLRFRFYKRREGLGDAVKHHSM